MMGIMHIVAAFISAMTISVHIMAMVVVAAKNHDARWRRSNDSDATATIHVANTPGKDNHRYHAKHGRADAETKPPHVAN